MSSEGRATPAGGLYLIDTSAWIFALRRGRVQHAAITKRIDELLHADVAATTGLVELELGGGALTEAEAQRLSQRLRGLHRIHVEDEDWRAGGRVVFALRRQGVTVPPTDGLLAALAMRHGAVMLHADRDFDEIAAREPLRVESLVEVVGR